MNTILVVVAALFIGFIVGIVGVGGILLPPVLELLAGMTTHMAMGTALFSFIFYTPVSSFLYWRAGQLDWRVAVPLCSTTLLFSYVGASLKAQLPATTLTLMLASIIIWAGVLVFFPMRQGGVSGFIHLPRSIQNAGLALIGAFVGTMAGLTGAGGPVLSIPIMILLGFAPMASIAVGQVLACSAAITGSIANYSYGALDIGVGVLVGLSQLCAVFLGIRVARLCNQARLRQLVASVSILVGVYLLATSILRLLA